MACSSEQYSDIKLPLRPWLARQIGRFDGLEWDESAAEGEKRFRVPWTKKGYPGWEKCYAIAKAWADHRGRDVQDFSELKQNLRVNLDKSEDFEYIPYLSESDKQTGNFRMYRFVSPRELPSKKKSLKRPRPKKRNIDCNPLSISKHDIDEDNAKALSAKDVGCFEGYYGTESQSLGYDHFLNESYQPTFQPTNEVYHNSLALVPPANGAYALQDTGIISVAQPPDGLLNETGRVGMQTSVTLTQTGPSVPVLHYATGQQATQDTDSLQQHATTLSTEHILSYVSRYGLKPDDLLKCIIRVRYNSEIVAEQTLVRLDKGCLVLYGDAEVKKHLLKTHGASEDTISDYDCPKIQLPRAPSSAGEALIEAIRLAELGVVIRLDPNSMCISAKRLCLGQVFYFDPHSQDPDEKPTKIEREHTVDIFSYGRYIHDHNVQYPQKPASVLLTIGSKPKSLREIFVKKGIQIEVIPSVFPGAFDNSENFSLYLSNPTNMDDILRQFNDTAI